MFFKMKDCPFGLIESCKLLYQYTGINIGKAKTEKPVKI